MPLLTPEQIEAILAILRMGSQAVSMFTAGVGPDATKEQVAALVRDGYLTREVADDLLRQAHDYGRLTSLATDLPQLPWGEVQRRMAALPPLTETEQASLAAAQRSAGDLCSGLGDRFRERVGIIGGGPGAAEQLGRDQVRDAVVEAVANRRGRSGLRSDLRQLTEDWTRDWDRIAATETQLAEEAGFFDHAVATRGGDPMMFKMPEPTACEHCRRLYLGPDGKPIVRPASWWAAQGDSNRGRKQAEWLPVKGAIHPWCRCKLMVLPAGMALNDAWEIVPEGDLEKGGQTSFNWEAAPQSHQGSLRRRVAGAGKRHYEYKKPGQGALPPAVVPSSVEPFTSGSWPTIGQRVRNAKDAATILQAIARGDRERLVVLSVKDGKAINVHVAHVGNMTGVEVHPLQVFKPAVLFGADEIHVAHNHPSGFLEPSGADQSMARRLEAVAKMAGIKVASNSVIASVGGAVKYRTIDPWSPDRRGGESGNVKTGQPRSAVPEVEFAIDPLNLPGYTICDADDAIRHIAAAQMQQGGLLLLDAKHRVVATHIGAIEAGSAFRKAVAHGAVSMITAGDTQPITTWEADQLGVKLLDHVTFQGGRAKALAGSGLLKSAHKLHYRTTFAGLPISIENRAGSIRRWHDPHNQTDGETKMRRPYGYIRLTEGADGEHLDCFLGPDESAPKVYVVNQTKAPTFKEFDEQKAMIGFSSAEDAKRTYLQHYSDPRFLGSMVEIPAATFRERVLSGQYRDGEQVAKGDVRWLTIDLDTMALREMSERDLLAIENRLPHQLVEDLVDTVPRPMPGSINPFRAALPEHQEVERMAQPFIDMHELSRRDWIEDARRDHWEPTTD